jgi:asparagine synthase (glutamine-hydrolysing)
VKSFLAIAGEAAQDVAMLQRAARSLRLPASSTPFVHGEGSFAVAVVSHRDETAGVIRAGGVTIAGEARLDGMNVGLLEAWQRWGPRFAEELRGEYGFVVWDANEGTLTAVRDRFGVRPLYYAEAGASVVVSDALAAMLAVPAIDASVLDDRAVAYYLERAVSLDAAATIYERIRRVPPAHVLTWRAGRVTLRRYWEPHVPERLHRAEEAREALGAALRAAVADRLPPAPSSAAVVFMSGGLDSTAIASLAHEARPDVALSAGTSVYRTRVAESEERWAAEAARAIGIPIHFYPLDSYPVLGAIEEGLWTPEPGPLLTAAMTRDIYTAAAQEATIALHGHPADALFAPDLVPFVRSLLHLGTLPQLVRALTAYTRLQRRLPYFARHAVGGAAPETLRPDAVRALRSPIWSSYFEWAHPLFTGAPLQLSYPYTDLRVVEAALAAPSIPSLVDKQLLRELMRGRLPEAVRTRRKSVMRADPYVVPRCPPELLRIEAAAQYVDARRFAEMQRDAPLSDAALRTVLFESWLRQLPRRVRQARS